MTPEELKRARASMGLTQSQMAERLGLSLAGYQNIESGGDKEVREVYALAVSALLGVPAQPPGPLMMREPERRSLSALKDGEIFYLPVPGGGRLVGMMGGTDHERRLIIFGSPGTNNEHYGAHWSNMVAPFANEVGLVIPNPMILLDRNPFGVAAPSEQPRTGAIVLDEAGARWLYVKQAQMEFYRLSDGQLGNPARGREYYNNWTLVWTPDGYGEPVALLRTTENPGLTAPISL